MYAIIKTGWKTVSRSGRGTHFVEKLASDVDSEVVFDGFGCRQ